MKPKICVVGSANIDQVSYVKRAPNDGETLFGEDYQMGFGGKRCKSSSNGRTFGC